MRAGLPPRPLRVAVHGNNARDTNWATVMGYVRGTEEVLDRNISEDERDPTRVELYVPPSDMNRNDWLRAPCFRPQERGRDDRTAARQP